MLYHIPSGNKQLLSWYALAPPKQQPQPSLLQPHPQPQTPPATAPTITPNSIGTSADTSTGTGHSEEAEAEPEEAGGYPEEAGGHPSLVCYGQILATVQNSLSVV